MKVFLHCQCQLCQAFFTVGSHYPKDVTITKVHEGDIDGKRVGMHECHESQMGLTVLLGVSWKEEEKK